MKKLLLISMLLLTACGLDPDDFKAEESDGCKSSDHECKKAKYETKTVTDTEAEAQTKTEEETTGNGQDSTTEEGLNCQANKICRGMSKEEVLEVLGEPITISDHYSGGVKWDYSDYSGKSLLCEFSCWVIIDKYGKLESNYKVSSDYIDPINY